jgi:hypothetical protein
MQCALKLVNEIILPDLSFTQSVHSAFGPKKPPIQSVRELISVG